MAAYRRVYGFGHLRADCRGPGSDPEPYAHFKFGTLPYPSTNDILHKFYGLLLKLADRAQCIDHACQQATAEYI